MDRLHFHVDTVQGFNTWRMGIFVGITAFLDEDLGRCQNTMSRCSIKLAKLAVTCRFRLDVARRQCRILYMASQHNMIASPAQT